MTIHYHGTPISPRSVLQDLAGRHFCVSFADSRDTRWCHDHGQGVMLDNGAFSVWRRGMVPDWTAYYVWTEEWLAYPTTWAVIPDTIDGSESENDALIALWPHGDSGTPVWHLHESIDRLKALCDGWARVCLGSSGEYGLVGSPQWHGRITEAMNEICKSGRVPRWLHMLRGMAAARWGYPFASVDSTDIARNHHLQQNSARRMADLWDSVQCSPLWVKREVQERLFA